MTPRIGESEKSGFLVVGLGNPGAEYGFNRHNIGFMVLDRLARELDLAFEAFGSMGLVSRGGAKRSPFLLLKPLTYMNRSGRAVGELMDRYRIPLDRVLVVSDEFQLHLGRIRLRRKGSDGGHKGLKSVVRTLGTEDFPRLRLGIGPVPEGVDPMDFVLEDFDIEEGGLLREALALATDALRLWLEYGDIDLCMNRYNRIQHE